MQFEQSKRAYETVTQLIPGGVNSPVRAFGAVGEHPVFIERGVGAHVFDVDGNELIDYVCSWGPLILGHCNEAVLAPIRAQLDLGSTFGMPTEVETKMAEKITSLVPSMEMVRMVSSGTEATMSALRLARGFTGRDKIVKFQGCYHGHADMLLIQAGSGAMTFGVPSSPGVPESVAAGTLSARYNDSSSVRALFEAYPNDIAAIIVEPIAGNMGLVPADQSFLEDLRGIATEYGAVLIFDEVISGFRASLGGAQAVYGVQPDLTCLGKIIGGGLPVGAFGGKKEIMDHLSPVGPVYQAGTLSGNPLAMQAGYATISTLEKEAPYAQLNDKAARLAQGLRDAAAESGVAVQIPQYGSLLTVFFIDHPVHSYDDAKAARTDQFATFFQSMLEQGVHLPPAQFECWFLSTAHTDDDLNNTLEAAKIAFAAVRDMNAHE